jgi:hypothetical protein
MVERYTSAAKLLRGIKSLRRRGKPITYDVILRESGLGRGGLDHQTGSLEGDGVLVFDYDERGRRIWDSVRIKEGK